MRIIVNGQEREVAEGARVSDLIQSLELAQAAVAVEVNRELVPKRMHAERSLNPGDRVEVVTLVGGG